MGTEEPFVLFLQLIHKLKYFKISKYIIPATKKKNLLWFNNHHGCCCCHHHPFTQKILDHKEIYQNVNTEKCLWVMVSQNGIPCNFIKDFPKAKQKSQTFWEKNMLYLWEYCLNLFSLTFHKFIWPQELSLLLLSRWAKESTLGNVGDEIQDIFFFFSSDFSFFLSFLQNTLYLLSQQKTSKLGFCYL